MSSVPSQEGKIPFSAPGIDKSCSTYYKIIGKLNPDIPPVVYLHGGPGGGHEYLISFAEQLWSRYSIPGILYDQIGCASSTHIPEKAGDGTFWTMSLFIAELDNLLDHLKLRDGPGFHLFGQSWGGMLGADFASSRPRGLRRLVLASALASYETMLQGVKLLRAQLEPEQQTVLDKAERSALQGNFEDWESSHLISEITGAMSKKHIFRGSTMPPELAPAFKNLTEDTTVYRTM